MISLEHQNELLKKLSNEYADYFDVDTSNQKKKLDAELECMLVQMEEYKSLLNETQVNTQELLEEEMKKISSYYQSLQTVFLSIDCMEKLVKEVRRDLNAVEACVAKAERTLGAESNINTVFKPFLFMKDPAVFGPRNPEDLVYVPPHRSFDVKNYFPVQGTTDENQSK